jgi:hypothetical protein
MARGHPVGSNRSAFVSPCPAVPHRPATGQPAYATLMRGGDPSGANAAALRFFLEGFRHRCAQQLYADARAEVYAVTCGS